MADHPTKLPTWATDILADIVEPSDGEKELGWQSGDAPPASFFNYWQNLVYQHVAYLDGRDKGMEQLALGQFRLIPHSGTASDFRGIATNETVAVAVGDSAAIQNTGITGAGQFTDRTAASSYADDFTDVIYEPASQLFIAVGENREIQTSPDGTTWTRRVTAGAGAHFRAAAHTYDGKALAVGDGGLIATTGNGTLWTIQTSAYGTNQINDCAASPDIMVAVGNSGEVQTSINDGTTWVSNTQTGTGTLAHIGWSAGVGFFARSTTHFLYSEDGLDWTVTAVTHGGDSLLVLDRGAYLFNGSAGVATSVRGIYSPFTSLDHSQYSVIDEEITNSHFGLNRSVWLCGLGGLIYVSPRIAL